MDRAPSSGARDIPALDIKVIITATIRIVLGVPPMGGGPDEQSALPRGDALGHDQADGYQCLASPACRPSPPPPAARACCTHSLITQRHPGHAVQVAHVAAQCAPSAYASKYVVVATTTYFEA